MLKLISILYFIFLSCTVNNQVRTYSQPILDSVFINWNKSTLESLNRQIKMTTDSLQKDIYKNRVLSTKMYWGINDVGDVNSGSVRYKFLKTVFAKAGNKKRDLYIIEANESGSKILLRTFILYRDSTNAIYVEFYDFFNEEWQKRGGFKEDNLSLQTDLRNYLSRFGKGFNYDDVVITEFKNGHVQQSEYYLYSTLSSESKIKKILEGYKKENFIK